MKEKATPASGAMKQKSISSFFAARPKTASPLRAKAKPGKTISPHRNNKENSKQPNATTPFSNKAGPSAAASEQPASKQYQTAEESNTAVPANEAAGAKISSVNKPTDKSQGNRVGTQQQQKTSSQPNRQSLSQPPPVTTPSPAGSAGAAAAGDADAGAGDSVVGRRIKVWWPKDAAWYEGVVAEFSDGKHKVDYDDGDEEWLDLDQERHKLLPATSEPAAAARKKHRKAVIVSDSEDDDEDHAGDASDDSNFEAAGDAGDTDEDMEDLEEEEQDDDGNDDIYDDEDVEDAAPGSKRKRAPSKVPRKRAASSSAVSALSTPAGAVINAANKGRAVPAKAPSSAGHTPMNRLTCGVQSTPMPGFPGFTPPVTALRDNGTPNAKLGLFRSCSRGSDDAAAGDGRSSGAEGSGAGLIRTGSTTPASGTPSATAFSAGTPLSCTPDTAAKAALQGALDVAAGADGAKSEPQIVLGVVASGGSEAARFAARLAERFPFLHPSRIKDKAGRRPSEPEYNPRTLLIPNAATWFKDKKVTEAQQQWWSFKSDNFDSVLLFKVGKFYEMFEMDAFVGVDVLGLQFMKGDQPHAGFPEAAYHLMAEQLARAGYRVVVVEQTETPEQLKARNAARKPGQKMVNVVDRQAVAVLSRGTLMDPEMVSAHPDAAYVLAVVEVHDKASGHDAPFIGACALDTAAGQILLGSWRDDEVRLKLRTQLTGLRPVEVVLPRRGSECMTAVTSRLCRCGGSRGPAPALNELPASCADAGLAVEAITQYYSESSKIPDILQQLQQQYKPGEPTESSAAAIESHAVKVAEAGLAAFGLMVQFLKDNMLDKALLPNAKFEPLCDGASGSDDPVAMELNGAALEGLEILENALGGTQGSLLGLLDHCTTPFGRRRLRRWLTRPLYRIKDIERRQDAIEELMSEAADAVSDARRALAGCSDLERCIARLGASVGCRNSGAQGGDAGGFGREAANVVLYEDVVKKRVKVLVNAMKDLRALQEALEAFSKVSLQSDLLAALTDSSRWADFSSKLDELQQAAEWDRAEREGVVRPSRNGVDPQYDAAKAAVEQVNKDLEDYLKQVKRELDCRSIKYISLNKESHVLEVPDDCKVPTSYCLVGTRKGFKRYSSDELKELVVARQQKEDEREKVEAGCLQALEKLFVSHSELWSSAIEAVAVLDCLMALAGAATAADGQMCRPKLLQPVEDGSGVFRAKQLRHPAGIASTACGSFVPNDISLGGDSPAFILLTGPNMGGKSTLLRQVCLATVLAQVGAMVPAESLELTPMDGCFVRMGARDAILSGQSTFYIEMAETAAMLSKSTSRSLVALDELGRGTATLDGAAIAAAVLEHLVQKTRCCGLFATHYHQLAAEHQSDPQVAIMHMACAVSDELEQPQQADCTDDGSKLQQVAEVTFLYQLTQGACPKSYGTNVARLAGLPGSVVSRAASISAKREEHCTPGVAPVAPAVANTGGAASNKLKTQCTAAVPSAMKEIVTKLQHLKQMAADDTAVSEVMQQLLSLQSQAFC